MHVYLCYKLTFLFRPGAGIISYSGNSGSICCSGTMDCLMWFYCLTQSLPWKFEWEFSVHAPLPPEVVLWYKIYIFIYFESLECMSVNTICTSLYSLSVFCKVFLLRVTEITMNLDEVQGVSVWMECSCMMIGTVFKSLTILFHVLRISVQPTDVRHKLIGN